ncbi:YbfB/YjiJ family MFS transporter [Azohydromonas aeria]|uniref:YbfB/YjiJ family MFS transporter n=1 Tax=Azohydromonas aeria TaxID=2590212 RepID=UPI0012FA5550|nr:YbfB/YjiJ family MFS transporter [Azohydromonas aeria]
MDSTATRAPSLPAAEAAATPLWLVCLAGALALAVAMGIGRFAFTPLLPLMQREAFIGSAEGAWLAAVNYLGYLVGALTASRLARHPRRLVLGSLVGTALVTAGAGVLHGFPAWLLLRGAAGVLSAWVMVGVSAWAIAALARGGRPEWGGWVYAGVGLGIMGAGGLGVTRAGDGAAALWLELGLLAVPALVAVAWAWKRDAAPAAAPAAAAPQPALGGVPRGNRGLVIAYGTFGFGYILPATYLPAMARTLVDDPRLFGLAWPAFGLAAAVSTLVAGRLLKRFRLFDVWAFCHGLMALGVLLPLFSLSGWSIGAAALAVGGTFMVATMAGLQLARARAAHHPAPLLSRMVAAFATGQIAGPLVALGVARLTGGNGTEPTLALAALLLVGTAIWLARQED